MNLRIVKAMLVEQALRAWPFLAGTLVLTVVLQFTLESLWMDTTSFRERLPLQMKIAICVAGIALLYTAADSDNLACNMPESLLRLPVPTFTLVATRFAFNIAAVVILTMCLVDYHVVFIDDLDYWHVYPIAAAFLFAVLQLCAYAFGGLGDWSIGILGGITALFLAIPGETVIRIPLLAPVVGIVLCLLASWAIVSMQRRGEWNFALRGYPAVRAHDVGHKDRPFSSKYTAQFWFEFVRVGSIFSVVLGGLIATLFAFTVLFIPIVTPSAEFVSIRQAAGQTISMLPEILLYATIAAGAFAAFQNYRLQYGPMGTFFYLRPLSSTSLSAMRVLSAFACFTVTTISIFALLWLASDLQHIYTLYTGAVWCSFWVINGLFVLGGMTAFAVIHDNLDWSRNYFEFLGPLIGILIIIGLFIIAGRRRIVAWRIVLPALIGIASVVLWVMSSKYLLAFDMAVAYFSNLFIVFLMLAPFATVPLVLHRFRHR